MAERRHQMLPHHPHRRWDDPPRREKILWRLPGYTTGAIYTVYRHGKLKLQILSMTAGNRTYGLVLNDDSSSKGLALW